MVYTLEGTSIMRQVADKYILWYIPSPILAYLNFSHAHPPPKILLLFPKHFLPCNMKGVKPSTPFRGDRYATLTLEWIFVCSSKSYW